MNQLKLINEDNQTCKLIEKNKQGFMAYFRKHPDR